MEKGMSKKKVNYGELAKRLLKKLIDIFGPIAKQIGKMSFGGMALLCLVLRLFVVYPLGPGAAILSGCIWAYWNLNFVKTTVLKGLWGIMGALGGHEQQSIWFEHEGRNKIIEVIDRLSAQGINYCNLVEQIEDLPPETQWYAICSGLKAMGIVAQSTRHALYITWRLPEAAAA